MGSAAAAGFSAGLKASTPDATVPKVLMPSSLASFTSGFAAGAAGAALAAGAGLAANGLLPLSCSDVAKSRSLPFSNISLPGAFSLLSLPKLLNSRSAGLNSGISSTVGAGVSFLAANGDLAGSAGFSGALLAKGDFTGSTFFSGSLLAGAKGDLAGSAGFSGSLLAGAKGDLAGSAGFSGSLLRGANAGFAGSAGFSGSAAFLGVPKGAKGTSCVPEDCASAFTSGAFELKAGLSPPGWEARGLNAVMDASNSKLSNSSWNSSSKPSSKSSLG